MHIGEIYKADSANGPGVRVSVFVSGCTIHCKGCFNAKTWDFNYGRLWTKETSDYLIKELSLPYYRGLTILGGEPFEPQNQPAVSELILRVRAELPEKDIWVYTGNTYDENLIPGGSRYIQDYTDRILDNIDVLVDGPFVEDLLNLNLRFRGSENQRIINMRETRKQGTVVLHPLNEYTPLSK
ncbi:MAG: anaerobic ribonucleoside-triphosphate reductase activating protein [Eubacterium sp.]|nr:anaerobic ribonucleoside-triphosphate reductase activating protein [Eubacterium sp.]